MDVEQYTVLTGRNYPTSKHRLIDAQIRRARSQLENLLGFTLDPELVTKNFYNELGKSEECSCLNVDPEITEEADPVFGAYRLFPYNESDIYQHIDPFTSVYAVKQVRLNGDEKSGITIKEFDNFVPHFNRDIGKYVELCSCWCSCACKGCLMLAVDAYWLFPNIGDSSVGDSSVGLSTLPDDLLYVWADFVTAYVDTSGIKSKTVGAHSWTKFDRILPEEDKKNRAILSRYAGPRGSICKVIV